MLEEPLRAEVKGTGVELDELLSSFDVDHSRRVNGVPAVVASQDEL